MDFFKGVYYGVLQFDTDSLCFALLMFIIVICLIRAMFNVAMFAILACIIFVAWLDYSPQDIYYKTESVIKETKEFARRTIEPILAENLKNADIERNEDGTYEIIVSNVRAVGKRGEDKLTIYYSGEKIVVKPSDFGGEVGTTLSAIANGEDLSSNIETDKESKEPGKANSNTSTNASNGN
ncbi:hypothetical protein CN918_25725 [Priestia megaterium]|nr:hypothetical protein CN918_25725 [Priestia megaterium]